MKICKECGICLDEGMFNKNTTYPDGLMSRCKECCYIANKRTKQALRERRRAEKESWVPDPALFKRCLSCGEEKSQTEYYFNPDYKDLCHVRCKGCESSKIGSRAKVKSESRQTQRQQEFNQ